MCKATFEERANKVCQREWFLDIEKRYGQNCKGKNSFGGRHLGKSGKEWCKLAISNWIGSIQGDQPEE